MVTDPRVAFRQAHPAAGLAEHKALTRLAGDLPDPAVIDVGNK